MSPAMLSPMRLGAHAVAALMVVVAGAGLWVWASSPSKLSRVTVLYVGADDCAPCRAWQRDDGARFRSSTEFASLTYREVKSPTLTDVLKDRNWPQDLRAYRDQLGRGAGVPLWLVIADGEIVGRGFGQAQWQASVLPQIKSLLR